MSYLLDTNVVSELRKRDPDPHVLAWYATVGSAELFLSVLTIGEIRLGIERLRRKDQPQADLLEQWLRGLHLAYQDHLIDVDADIAEAWGRLGKLLLTHAFVEQAAECFANAERFGPRDPRWPYLRAITLLAQNDSSAPAIAAAVGKECAPPGASTPRFSTSAAVIFRVPDQAVFVVQIVLTTSSNTVGLRSIRPAPDAAHASAGSAAATT